MHPDYPPARSFAQAALLAGRTNKALVGREEFSAAVLRSVAGIEKKRSILQGMEKEVVARHEVGAVGQDCQLSKQSFGGQALSFSVSVEESHACSVCC